jgi:four helix bundle protein
MAKDDLKERTEQFSLRVMNLVEKLHQGKSMSVISNQILRSATSVGANYRAARRAKSKRDFINKLKIVEEEADETLYWLGLIQRSGKIKPEKLQDLVNEASELLAIFVASIKTAKKDIEGKVQRTKDKGQTKVGSTKFEGRTTAG